MPEFQGTAGRSAEIIHNLLTDVLVDSEKPHARAIPVYWFRGDLDGCAQAVGEWGDITYRQGRPLIVVTLSALDDPETGEPVNAQIFHQFALGAGDPFIFATEKVDEFAFIGWSLRMVPEDERAGLEA